MSVIKKILLLSVLMTLSLAASAEEIKKIGKVKDWEAMVLVRDSGITCFAQSKPVLQAPKTNKRDARLFVSFRPNEKIKEEISITPGYEFNKKNSITAKSGNQILMIKTVDIDILAAPTRLLIIFDKPKCLNSSTILSNLTTQTIKIEMAIVILKSVIIFSILQFSYFFQNPELLGSLYIS